MKFLLANGDLQFHSCQRWPYRLVEFPLAHSCYGLAQSPAGWHQSWNPSGKVDVLTRSQSHQTVSRYQLRTPCPSSHLLRTLKPATSTKKQFLTANCVRRPSLAYQCTNSSQPYYDTMVHTSFIRHLQSKYLW